MLAINGRVLTRIDGGNAGDVDVDVTASFEATVTKTSNSLTMSLLTTEIKFISFENIKYRAMGSNSLVRAGKTLSGPVDARARLIFGGTTSDNRKFDKLMDNNGNPVFAGMAAFSASRCPLFPSCHRLSAIDSLLIYIYPANEICIKSNARPSASNDFPNNMKRKKGD